MKLIKYLIVLMIFLFSTFNFAQVPKKVLMEYATNASCGPCAAYNPGNYEFLKSNYKNAVAVWYHAWWPGSNDPMYVINKPENEARINYYGINGVPAYVINGTQQGYGDETAKFHSHFNSQMNLESPLEMNVKSEMQGDSIKITVLIKVLAEITSTDLRLHTAITEQMVKYDSPPGSNGEMEFPHVFRKFCKSASGEILPALNIGDSLVFSYTEEINSEWDPDVLTMVAWVQSNSAKTVLQSASNLFFYQLTSSVPKVNLIQKNQTLNNDYSIENIMDDTLKLRIKPTLVDNEENWNYSLHYSGSDVDSFDVQIATGEIVNFSLNVETNNSTGFISITITAENLDENSDYKSKIEYFGVVTAGDILIVDDDGGENYETNYTRTFLNNGTEFTKISSQILPRIEDVVDLKAYKYVIWNFGNYLPALENFDVAFLMDYLNAGGNLFLAGQDLGYDIHEISNSNSPKFFYSVYLDALYIHNTDSSTSVESVPGNPLFDNFSFTLNDIHALSPDAIQSKRGKSIPVLKFSDTDNDAMLIYNRNDAKIAYLSVGLEQISPESAQDTLITTVMKWFDTPTGIEDNKLNNSIPEKYSLNQNYPNPFNPNTIIKYTIPTVVDANFASTTSVELKVYDVLGKEVATLVNENKKPGFYEVTFNAPNLNSGVYYYRLTAGEFSSTKKMVLLK